MRAIPPTLKDRPRYCFVPDADHASFERIEASFEHLFGTVGLAAARLVLVGEEIGGIVLRVDNGSLWQLRVAIVALPEPLGIARVSGTLARLRAGLRAQQTI